MVVCETCHDQVPPQQAYEVERALGRLGQQRRQIVAQLLGWPVWPPTMCASCFNAYYAHANSQSGVLPIPE